MAKSRRVARKPAAGGGRKTTGRATAATGKSSKK